MVIVNFSGKAQHGKDTCCNILKEKLESIGKKVLILHFASYLKYLCKEYFEWDGKKDKKGREILQQIGTNIVRNRNPDFWVDNIIEFMNVFEEDYDYFLIGDCRFKNEICKLKDKGFKVIAVRVNRPNFDNGLTEEQKLHPSETSLDDFEFDYYIENDKEGLDKLAKKIDTMILKGVID